MASATISASITVKAPAEATSRPIDPAKHAAIDGTGWVRDAGPSGPDGAGADLRMGMYHANHRNGNYEMANRVQVLDRPHAISWEPGHDPGDGNRGFGGWIWRYDLAPLGPSETEVRLSYDWSAVPEVVRHRASSAFLPRSPGQFVDPRRRLVVPDGEAADLRDVERGRDGLPLLTARAVCVRDRRRKFGGQH